MTPEQFAYWLQGFVELNPTMQQPTPEQWKAIGEHLQTVFVKVTPQVLGGGNKPSLLDPKVFQEQLDAVRRIQESMQVPRRPDDSGLFDFSRGGQYPGGPVLC